MGNAHRILTIGSPWVAHHSDALNVLGIQTFCQLNALSTDLQHVLQSVPPDEEATYICGYQTVTVDYVNNNKNARRLVEA